METKIVSGEPLNILHTIDLDKLYPIIRCQLQLSQALDVTRFKEALTKLGHVIPEIFAGYDLNTNQWHIQSTNPNQLVHILKSDINVDTLTLDLQTGPQLYIYLQDTKPGQKVTFVISHILTDGAGFKQLLYLLANFYNHPDLAPKSFQNHTDIEGLKEILEHRPKSQNQTSDHPADPLYLPTLQDATAKTYYVGHQTLSKTETKALIHWAQKNGVTLNDIFMAAFGSLMQSYAGVAQITLACPTDTRQYLPQSLKEQLRVQNATARYNLALPNILDQPLTKTIQAVHRQMTTLKNEQQFLQSVQQLIQLSKTATIEELRQVVFAHYSVRPIAYTNFGIIDANRLNFKKITIQSCLFTGSFRKAPAFQVAFSTFNQQLTMSFNMIGSPVEINFGNTLLRQLRQSLELVYYQ